MTRFRAAFTTLAYCVVSSPLGSQEPSDSAVLALLQPRVDAGVWAGIVVGLVDRDGVRRTLAYGPNAGVAPLDARTVFEIGSITKTFTGALLADMVRRGEVTLDDPVAKYLPTGTVVPSRAGRQITLLDLATQTSGLPRMPANFTPKDATNPYADYTPAQLYEFLRSYQLTRGIGERYEYSNLGIGLLGHALSLRAGKSYEALVTERILAPLQMQDTRISLTPGLRQRLAPGHAPDGSVVGNWDLQTLEGAGGLRSTVHDMLSYIRANADSTSAPLGATLALTHGMRRAGSTPAVSLGLAWHRLLLPSGYVIVFHDGGTGGYRSFVGYSERTGAGVVVLANTSTSVTEIGFRLLEPGYPVPPVPRKRTAIALPAETLERYVGTFEFSPSFAIIISREGAQLFLQATGQSRFPLFAEQQDEFFLKVVDAQVSFTRDSAGAIAGLILHQNGVNQSARKKR
jgi:CubicO group peptidase (beta-lactamase class C family)